MEKLSSKELKALYYDQLVQIEIAEKGLQMMKQNLNTINGRISDALNQEAEAEKAQVVAPAPAPVEAPKAPEAEVKSEEIKEVKSEEPKPEVKA